MLSKKIKAYNAKLLLNYDSFSKKNRVLFLVCIYLVAFSVFTTIFGQLPPFSARQITQIFQIPWLLVVVPIVILSYKSFLKNLVRIILLISPFLSYILLSLIFGLNPLSFDGTILFFVCAYICLLGMCLSPCLNKYQLRLFLSAYLFAALIYGIIVYLTKLRGLDFSGSNYLLGSKNSTGPILLIGALCAFYLFDKKSASHLLISLSISAFFIVLIGITKCRTILIAIPLVAAVVIHYKVQKPFFELCILFCFLATVVIVLSVPQLNKLLVQDILLNGKDNIDDIFSGRPSLIADGFAKFKPFLGNGGYYVDCMPICCLLSYGILGFATVLPFLFFPVYILIKSARYSNTKSKRMFVICILIVFFFEMLLEGFGYFGPGAKAFIFWLLAGFESSFLFEKRKNRKCNRIHNIPENIAIRVNPFYFSLGIQTIILFFALISIPSNIFSNKLATTVYYKLPSSTVVTNYNEATDVDLAPERLTEICVGQRITIPFSTTATEWDDLQGRIYDYNSAQLDKIKIDAKRNEIVALKPGFCAFGYISLRKAERVGYVTVFKDEDYHFDNIYISTKKYTYSFEHKNDESIDIGIGTFNKVYFDNYYIPEGLNYSFVSSDETVALVDKTTGVIKGVGKGVCKIYLTLNNSAGTFLSKNTINVNVLDDTKFVECTSMELSFDSECFQYEPFTIKTDFNVGATDTRVLYSISNPNYRLNKDSIVFLQSGLFQINVSSISNPSLSQNIDLVVLDNAPVSFSCLKNRIKVGETYSPNDLSIFINYSSGNSYIVTNDDIYFDPIDLRGRAWHETNGLVKDYCTVKAVKTGFVSLSLESLADSNVKSNFTFNVLKHSEKEFENWIMILTTLIIAILSLLAIVHILIIPLKKKTYKSFLIILTSFLLCGLFVAFNGFGPFSITLLISLSLISITLIALNHFLLKNNWPHLLNEDFIIGIKEEQNEICFSETSI